MIFDGGCSCSRLAVVVATMMDGVYDTYDDDIMMKDDCQNDDCYATDIHVPQIKIQSITFKVLLEQYSFIAQL